MAASEQMKKLSFALDQKHAKKLKDLLKTIQMEMHKQSSWGFFVKGVRNIYRKVLCAGVSILIKLHPSRSQFIKTEIPAKMFSYEIREVFIEQVFCRI